ncbi:hypothetical protein [Nocardia wallacei]|uniref:hypothetical protein n=1 Tax=Nocardia wallacei TaxID=480035 RepID=UPI002453C5C5|nr:hypothetical protein [Nocardia wallacei]
MQRADELFQLAYRHADEAGDTDVAAGVLCCRTKLALATRQYSRAADLADAMLLIPVRDGRMVDFRRLCAAKAFATAGRHRHAWAQLDRGTDDFAEQTTPDESYAYYHSRWVTGRTTAQCLALSGEFAAAADRIEATLPLIPPHMKRDRAKGYLELARVAAETDIERACTAARDAIDLTRGWTSYRVMQVYADTRARMAPWETSRAVRQLDDYATGVLA